MESGEVGELGTGLIEWLKFVGPIVTAILIVALVALIAGLLRRRQPHSDEPNSRGH